MTKRELLIEQYEDALFALLMDEVAEAEGEAALRLNEQLRDDPAAEVPASTRKRCEKTIRRAFARQRVRRAGRAAGRVLQTMCVVVAICVALFTTAFAAVEEFRVATLNALIEAFDDRTEITFPGVQGGTEGAAQQGADAQTRDYVLQEYGIGLEWLPEGYRVETGHLFPGSCNITMRDDVESQILIAFDAFHPGLTYTFDTEQCEEKPVTIQGYAATLYVKTKEGLRRSFGSMPQIWSKQTIVWLDHEEQMIGFVSATNLTEEEILRLAEGACFCG